MHQVHPTGRFRRNTALFILAKENGLLGINRISFTCLLSSKHPSLSWLKNKKKNLSSPERAA
jgi:hypothetical protein